MATAVSRPVSLPPDVPRLPRRSTYDPPQAEVCQRCEQKVYPMEKVGNISGVTFHKLCFRCAICNQMLTLRTYYTNHTHSTDKEVYCSKHAPLQTTRGLDTQALGIKANLHATSLSGQKAGEIGAGRFGADALFLKHAVQAQQALELARRTNRNMGRHHFNPGFVAGVARAKLLSAQKELERKYRVEENSMLEMVRREQQHEEMRIDAEWREEWEVRLQELTERHERTLNAAGKAKAALHRRSKQQGEDGAADDNGFEEEKEELKEKMTMRLNAKRQEVAKRYQEREREETARLVRSQSVRMMNDLRTVQDAIKLEMQQELKDKLKSEQRLNARGQGQDENGEGDAGGDGEEVEPGEVELVIAREVDEALAELVPHRPPCPPHPPRCRRRDLFDDVSVFARLDDIVGKIAEEEPTTYSDLVFQLTQNCCNDLEKARAIYRWITMKDLNHMDIDVSAEHIDSPMGLLHGIKHGTEAYHTLFMRLCGYAGLGCVEVKGHSKSVGYEPGMRMDEDSFLNTWNAVQIDSDWWPVQCNWGARHLVLNKDRENQQHQHRHHQGGSKGKQAKDKIRYQFDEHYFLTDPDEFVKEFWASEPDWQLLEQPITLEQFEATPFVRSVFFHCGLEFDQPMAAVLHTDSKGGVEVRLRVPIDFDNDIVFHYNLAPADGASLEQNQVKLERFVFHFRHEGLAVFTVHVPQRSQYFLEIYANRINESNRISDDPSASMLPFRLKCACKFKVVCEGLAAKMRPLPDCHSGEWGPAKGTRHLALQPLSHKSPVVDVVSSQAVTLTLTFRLPRPFHFVARLKANGRHTADLADCTSCSLNDENEHILEVKVTPPDPGQYGLDLYARPEDTNRNVEKQAMVHVCKYLLNIISDVRSSSQASLREA